MTQTNILLLCILPFAVYLIVKVFNFKSTKRHEADEIYYTNNPVLYVYEHDLEKYKHELKRELKELDNRLIEIVKELDDRLIEILNGENK